MTSRIVRLRLNLSDLSTTVLSVKNLSKSYGPIHAVDGLDLEIEAGNIYGILGPNGSGKTTTLGILLDVVGADSGDFSWFGRKPSKEDRRRIGSILEVPLFYPYLTGYQNLKLVSRIKKASFGEIDEKLKMTGMWDRRHSPFRTYSLGMKQRLAISAAMLGDPDVLILDEPTNGLDPKGIAEIREMILEIGSRGITIILASHILDEVQKICTHVAVLRRGKKLFSGAVDEVLNDQNYVVVGSGDLQRLKQLLENSELVSTIREDGKELIVGLSEGVNAEELNRWAFSKGIVLSHLAVRKKSLESYFLELMEQ